nr:hypothetical protein [uncultured Mucilaginibacter sp.]
MKKLAITFAAVLIAMLHASGQTNTFPTTGSAGIETTSPTNSLTLGSAATGIAAYNTTDQTTNYERFLAAWASNVFILRTNSAGTGSTRAITLGIGSSTFLSRSITVANSPSASGVLRFDYGSISGATSGIGMFGTFSASTAVIQNAYAVVPTVNQTSGVAAGYRALWVSPYESSLGTGMHYLVDAGINSAALGAGTHTSLFTVDNTGNGYFAGKVGIGTSTPHTEALSVNGKIRSQEVTVETSGWPDYVFATGYTLPGLNEVKAYIDKNQHLPGMPSAAELEKDGLKIGEMNKLLMKKVEELTLYLIEKDKQVTEQEKTNKSLQEQIDFLMDQLKLKMPEAKTK